MAAGNCLSGRQNYLGSGSVGVKEKSSSRYLVVGEG